MISKVYQLLKGVLPALLTVAVISGSSVAAGDLFDDEYTDCPAKTRLAQGQISDLAVTRDTEEADKVNVGWSATSPGTWNLGANAYNANLVVILDDGNKTHSQSLSLGSRKIVFDDVATGLEITVQLAIVVATPDGDFVVSDILEQRINQSVSEPAFLTTEWQRVTTPEDRGTEGTQFMAQKVPMGTFYYVGYNKDFSNYRADSGLTTEPHTPRLRIGLRHGGEDDDKRKDVDFDVYLLRITDETGDVVPEGNDVATIESAEFYVDEMLHAGFAGNDLSANTTVFSNMRISEAGKPTVTSLQRMDAATLPFSRRPISIGGITVTADDGLAPFSPESTYLLGGGAVFVEPPNVHRDFPIDILSSDTTYQITAWAVNDARETISPTATLKVRPVDSLRGTVTNFTNANNNFATLTNFVTTEFTVLK